MISQGYIIDSQICIIALYLFYILILRRRIAHKYARAYLLAMLPVAMILPLLSIPILPATQAIEMHGAMVATNLSELPGWGSDIQAAKMTRYFSFIYIIGALFIFFWSATGIIKLVASIRKNRAESMEGMNVIFAEQKSSAYSVFNFVFINEKFRNTPYFRELLAHEKCHMQQNHTLDLIFACAAKITLWFNPAAWHLGYLLKEVHEFQADNSVIDDGYSLSNYANLLIMSEAGICPEISNQLSYKLTKNRIKMLSKAQKNNRKRIVFVLPIVVVLMSLFSLTTQASEEPNAATPAPSEIQQDKRTIESPPQFPGGDAALIKFLNENVRYPKEAIEAGASGRIVVQFEIGINGEIGKLSVVQGGHKSLEEEAFRLVKLMPRWIPGTSDGKAVPAYFNLPVTFKTQGR